MYPIIFQFLNFRFNPSIRFLRSYLGRAVACCIFLFSASIILGEALVDINNNLERSNGSTTLTTNGSLLTTNDSLLTTNDSSCPDSSSLTTSGDSQPFVLPCPAKLAKPGSEVDGSTTLTTNGSSFTTNGSESFITVVLMVKNEEKVICKTLDPLLNAGVRSFFIYDTGSTDNTMEVARKYFEDNKISKFYIFQEEFVDFSTSRNRALDIADEQFPDAKFYIMPDAEWYLHNGQDLIEFCKDHAEEVSTKSYLIKITLGSIDFWVHRVIRAHSKVRFGGVVHEALLCSSRVKVPDHICFHVEVSHEGGKKTEERWKRDLKLLLKDHEENPDSPRTTFYLAQTYESLGDLHNAYKYYWIRSAQPGWDEENYETFYRLGRVTVGLMNIDPENFKWEMAQSYFSEAYKMRPHRAEPLFRLAEHYWPDNAPLAFIYAQRACALPYPTQETLFVDRPIYEFWRWEILCKTAWYVNEFAIGEMATRKAIEYNSNLAYLYRNLSLYLEKRIVSA